MPPVYIGLSDEDFICSRPEHDGMTRCTDIPSYVHNGITCNAAGTNSTLQSDGSCIDWNRYYSACKPATNPFKGSISFDNIGLAWVAIFQVSDYFSSLLAFIYAGGDNDEYFGVFWKYNNNSETLKLKKRFLLKWKYSLSTTSLKALAITEWIINASF